MFGNHWVRASDVTFDTEALKLVSKKRNIEALGALDFKRLCTEWSVYDIKVPRER